MKPANTPPVKIRAVRTKAVGPSTLSPEARKILARTRAARAELDARCEGAEP